VHDSISTNSNIVGNSYVSEYLRTGSDIDVVSNDRCFAFVRPNIDARVNSTTRTKSHFVVYNYCPSMGQLKPWSATVDRNSEPKSNSKTVQSEANDQRKDTLKYPFTAVRVEFRLAE
jgi:hypothetical protein